MSDATLLSDNPTKTFHIDSPKPDLNGLNITVKPNNGPLMREVGKLAQRRKITINYSTMAPAEAYENALLTAECLVVEIDQDGTKVERPALRKLLEKYDSLAKLIREQGQTLQDEIEGVLEVAEKN